MFSAQRKKEALGRGTVKLLPRNLLSSVCDHVRSPSLFILLEKTVGRGVGGSRPFPRFCLDIQKSPSLTFEVEILSITECEHQQKEPPHLLPFD